MADQAHAIASRPTLKPYTVFANEPHVRWVPDTNEIYLEAAVAKGPEEEIYNRASHKRDYNENSSLCLSNILGVDHNGRGVWGTGNLKDFHIHDVKLLEKHNLHVEISENEDVVNGNGLNIKKTTRIVKIDLTERISRSDDGDLIYVEDGTDVTYGDYPGLPGFTNDPLKDGNIQASAFTVASDTENNRIRVAYKTQLDDKISMAEILFENGRWHDPTEIETWASKMPGANFALVFDPVKPKQRHLFFSEPDGDGYIYQQTFRKGKWLKPRKPRDLQGKEMAIKAHRFSGFAGTTDHEDKILLFYFIDESNSLLEYAGKWYPADGTIPEGYRWTRTQAPDAENLTLRGHIAAINRDKKTYLVYRGRDHELIMAIGRERKPWEVQVRSKHKRGDKRGDAEWTEFVVREKHQLAKLSPLAVAVGPGDEAPKVFYLHKDRKTETIMALDILHGVGVYEILRPVPVGKLEPGSDIAAASLPKATSHNIRLFSVSKLDGDNVLIERVQKGCYLKGSWVIAGGVVDTDIDHCDPRSLDAEHTKTDDD